jgi:hypothetical protein
MKQKSFFTAGFELITKRKRNRASLDEMNLMVLWTELVTLIEPHAPSGKTRRPRLQAPVVSLSDFLTFNSRCNAGCAGSSRKVI